MDIQKYIDEIKNSEKEEPIRGVEMDTILNILEKLKKEFNLTAVDTRPRPRRISSDDAVDANRFNRSVNMVFMDDLETTAHSDLRRGQLWHAIDASLTLSEEERRIALEYIEINFPHSNQPLGGAFTWLATPQGEEFWFRVDRQMSREFDSASARAIMRMNIPTALKRIILYGFNKLKTMENRSPYWLNSDTDNWGDIMSWTFLPDYVGINVSRYIGGESEISRYFTSFWNEPNLIKLTPEDLWKVAVEVMSFYDGARNWREVYPWANSDNWRLYATITEELF